MRQSNTVGIVAALCVTGVALFSGLCLPGCDRVAKEMRNAPDIKIVNWEHKSALLGNDVTVSAEIRNRGAGGNVRFTFRTDAGQSWNHQTYFDRDEERKISFVASGVNRYKLGYLEWEPQ
jgi:hypothetical protein